ncbi:hypothetical protein GE300_11055 [Rhodobacteraceae bacterium 2CG4]|uniref:APCDD1 domain-containing protein n=1 Tax=Halovulum marinum TaxID=2662447 RepID=A0A6L5Z1I7_9RHOB|nr:hypothetical protein [Halovulum marinum]MSU90149.1 hypothetical protein [Halovulum marinum]
MSVWRPFSAVRPCRGMVLALALALLLVQASLPTANAAHKDTLDGEWLSGCTRSPSGDRGYITRAQITMGRIDAVFHVFATPSCDRPIIKVHYRGEIVLLQAEGDSLAVDHRVRSFTLTPNTAEVARRYNGDLDGTGCGLSGWRANVPFSVAGRSCSAFAFADEGGMLFDRAWLTAEGLRFGAFPHVWSITAPERRPDSAGAVLLFRTGY